MDEVDLRQIPLFREFWLYYLTFDDPDDRSDYDPEKAGAGVENLIPYWRHPNLGCLQMREKMN